MPRGTSKAQIKLAWAAGLFDGEGSIFASTSKNRPRYVRLNMAVVMTDQEPVDRFCQAVGIGKVTELNRKTVTGKTAYRWVIQGTSDVRKAVEKLQPYLSGPKLNQAWLALAARDRYDEDVEKTARTVCRNGHSFPENRREWPNGNGYCIVCLEARKKRAKEKVWPS